MDRKSMLGAATAAVLAAGGVGGVAAAMPDDADANVTSPEADKASDAAVDAAGGGRVESVERESEGSVMWEVEVVMPDGRVMELELDQDYGVVASEQDDSDSDADEPDDDADDDLGDAFELGDD